jgi:hypothetical protein
VTGSPASFTGEISFKSQYEDWLLMTEVFNGCSHSFQTNTNHGRFLSLPLLIADFFPYPSSSAEVKNVWSCISLQPYAFMTFTETTLTLCKLSAIRNNIV